MELTGRGSWCRWVSFQEGSEVEQEREKEKGKKKVVRNKISWATTLVGMWMNANGLELFMCNLVGRGSAQWPFVVCLRSRKSH